MTVLTECALDLEGLPKLELGGLSLTGLSRHLNCLEVDLVESLVLKDSRKQVPRPRWLGSAGAPTAVDRQRLWCQASVDLLQQDSSLSKGLPLSHNEG